MRFFEPFLPSPRDPRPPLNLQLQGEHVLLRAGESSDWKAWRALREASEGFLRPWEPEWAPNGLTQVFFDGMLRRQWRDWRERKAYAFFVFQKREGRKPVLAGGIGLNDIQRGIAQKGTLGYWIGMPYARQGLMTEAAGLVCDFAFHTAKLHRVEASCLPGNEASKALLKRLGFDEEGYAKSYLRINGAWADHLLWGKADSRDADRRKPSYASPSSGGVP